MPLKLVQRKYTMSIGKYRFTLLLAAPKVMTSPFLSSSDPSEALRIPHEDGWTGVSTEGQKLPVFYGTSPPFGAATQKVHDR